MSAQDDGGPAFPSEQGHIPNGTWNQTFERGMTLRDWFAGQALAGMLAHSRNNHGYRPSDPNQHWHEAITQESYAIADAMLAAREAKQ